jgi:hypothetical protein
VNIDQGAVAAIAIFLAAQTGALIFYSGFVSRTLSDHERRLNNIETTDRADFRVWRNQHQREEF